MLRAAFAICWALHGVHALVAPNGNNHRVCNRGQPPSRLSRLCAEKTSPRELYVKSAEEEMDELDDLIMDRPYSMGTTEPKMVKMFGVWLDPDVAGRHVGKSIVAVNDGDDDVPLTPEEEAAEAGAVFFSEGVKAFQKGDYAAAALILSKAVERADDSQGPRPTRSSANEIPPGMLTRKGGEYALWLAQALHAQGDSTNTVALRREACALLKQLQLHRDRAVSRVAGELLYIYEAPRIELDEDSFLRIPDMSNLDPYQKKKQKKMSLKSDNDAYAIITRGPEKYSLEWLKEQRTEELPPVDIVPPLVAAALCLGSLVFFSS